MRKMYILPTVLIGVLSYGQVGINNVTPKTTLDVTSKTTDGSASEGFMVPRLTGEALHAAETAGPGGVSVYGADQDTALVFVTTPPNPANRTGQVEGMDVRGFYYFDAGSNRWVKMVSTGTVPATVSGLQCTTPTRVGTLAAGTAASGVSIKIHYTGGNGGGYSGVSAFSQGITGLTATLASGTLNNGDGDLILSISGTPSGTVAGNAIFNLSNLIPGATCGNITFPVQAATSSQGVVPVRINGQQRYMMTHNLGADTTQDPNFPNKAIMGSYYQWGRLNPAVGVNSPYYDDPITTVPGWDGIYGAGNGSWQDGTKTGNDPCPNAVDVGGGVTKNFRVPTQSDWAGLISASGGSAQFIGGTWVASPTDYSKAMQLTDSFYGSKLTFPAAGSRFESTGILVYRALSGNYWSSTKDSLSELVYALDFLQNSILPQPYYDLRTRGFSVRCISEN